MIINIEDLRKRARRRLPRAVFDYIDGAAEDELTARRNREYFQRLLFDARVPG
jgi:L-lactate dehydrogenase (FMN-dependent) and related alpha-hydroxy acid dehydrogenases